MAALKPRNDIKHKMLDRSMKLTDLALQLSIPLTRLSNYINGHSPMPKYIEVKIMNILK